MSGATVTVTGVTAAGGTNDGYEYTQNWFQYAEHIWPEVMKHLPERRDRRRIMEIGSFEGRSAVWIVENIMFPNDQLLCVDTWEGGDEHHSIDMQAVEKRFDANIQKARMKRGNPDVQKVKETSTWALAHQLRWVKEEGKLFDFIYIDGSHRAPDVLADAVMAWKLLRMNGILIFDDYLWGDPRKPLSRPKTAIDAFMNIYGGEINVMNIGLQMIIKKVTLP